jgi:probable F420-dependent oxidoreductase
MKIGGVMFFTTESMQPAELGRAMEERGFESVWVPEHTHVPLGGTTAFPTGSSLPRPYFDIYDPFLALTSVATATSRLKIGTGITLVVQRDPIVTAKMVSTIDQISHGRFLFGVGNGWNKEEIENHGTEFATRHKLGRERIEAMMAIWTQTEPSYDGEFVKFGPINQWPKPVQKPFPPVIVGGAFPQAARRAIRYGQGWIPHSQKLDETGLGATIEQFRKMAVEAGRDPADLPVTMFRVPDDLEKLRFCQQIGIDRVVFSLPEKKADEILPILDRWAAIKQALRA